MRLSSPAPTYLLGELPHSHREELLVDRGHDQPVHLSSCGPYEAIEVLGPLVSSFDPSCRPLTHRCPHTPTAFLEKGEPFRERSPQHSVSTKGLGPCASQPEGPFSLKTALITGFRPKRASSSAHSCTFAPGLASLMAFTRSGRVS